jgi:photosystem II stability/assembly factor-like uncharacterized protein
MQSVKFFSCFIFTYILVTYTVHAQNNWVPTNGPYGGSINMLKTFNNNLYAATNCGIYMTSDSGVTWEQKCAGLGACKIFSDIDLVGNTLLTGTLDNGMFISTDMGANWIQANSGLNDPFLDYYVYDICVNGNDVLIGTANGVYKSSNFGLSWSPSNIGITETNNINALKIVKQGSLLFLGTQSDIYKSSDNGFSWVALNNTIGANASSLISSGGSLYVTGIQGLYKSINNGTTWTLLNTNLPTQPFLIFAVGSNLYCSQNSSTYVSTNGGTNWSLVTSLGFNTICELNNKVFGGNLGGAYSWALGSSVIVNSGLGGSSKTHVLFQDGAFLYAGSDNGIYRTSNFGNTWTNVGLGLPLNTIVNCIAKSGNNLIVGTKGNGTYISSNNGNSWSQSINGLTINGVYYSNVTAILEYNGRLFMGAKENTLFSNFATVFRSDNNGASWIQSATGLDQNTNVSSFSNFGNYIILGSKNVGVYLSTDNGNSWLFDGLSQSVNSLCSNTLGYYAVSSDIVHSTSDMGNNWTSFDFDTGSSGDIIYTIANLNNVIYTVQDVAVQYLSNGNWILVPSGGLSGGVRAGIVQNQLGEIFLGARGSFNYGSSYYQVENGVSKYLGSNSSVEENQISDVNTIYPNPINGELTIELKNSIEHYSIHNELGQVIMSGKLNFPISKIDVSNINQGIYFIQIGENKSNTFKIVKL